ncbi:MAG: LCP family protein [Lachnospiraceae bacterium]|nr:LCP family protein [Lachnospiraceae bacterium]
MKHTGAFLGGLYAIIRVGLLAFCLVVFGGLLCQNSTAAAEENTAAESELSEAEDQTDESERAEAVEGETDESAGTEAVTEEAETETETSGTRVSLPGDDGIYSILLIGSDRRDDSWNGNSDVMIVVTVNSNTKKIIMTSYMRDLYADIPGYGVHKLNYAYAAGGADKLIETLEDNYEIEIDNYAAVDFDGMAEIIDLIGGVDIEVTDDEVSVLNNYLSTEDKEYALEGGGSYHLNGAQAVAYMRIRYVGNADYQRTQRQRDVLTEIFAQAQEMSAAQLTELAQEVLELVDHDISALDMISLLGSLSGLTEYELVENRIPYDGLFTSQNEMLVPDFAATIEKLHEVLYE